MYIHGMTNFTTHTQAYEGAKLWAQINIKGLLYIISDWLKKKLNLEIILYNVKKDLLQSKGISWY